MSNINADTLRYAQPEIQNKTQTKFSFNQLRPLQTNSNIKRNVGNQHQLQTVSFFQKKQAEAADYPVSGKHSRYPVFINCQTCNELTLTEVEHENGFAAYIWCLLLSPILLTGCCCLCMNSFKDVRHKCSKCRKEAGICKSKCLC